MSPFLFLFKFNRIEKRILETLPVVSYVYLRNNHYFLWLKILFSKIFYANMKPLYFLFLIINLFDIPKKATNDPMCKQIIIILYFLKFFLFPKTEKLLSCFNFFGSKYQMYVWVNEVKYNLFKKQSFILVTRVLKDPNYF